MRMKDNQSRGQVFTLRCFLLHFFLTQRMKEKEKEPQPNVEKWRCESWDVCIIVFSADTWCSLPAATTSMRGSHSRGFTTLCLTSGMPASLRQPGARWRDRSASQLSLSMPPPIHSVPSPKLNMILAYTRFSPRNMTRDAVCSLLPTPSSTLTHTHRIEKTPGQIITTAHTPVLFFEGKKT